jgi:5-methylcytosine-specific restriction endonuclease McrA
MVEMKRTTKTCSVCHRETRSTSRGMCGNCYRIWQRDHFPSNTTCDVCGRAYFRRPCAPEAGRTCTRECYKTWKLGRNQHNKLTDGATLLPRECEWCGDSFVVPQRQIDKGFGRFCSTNCSGVRRRYDPAQSINPENAWRQREGFRKLSAAILADPDMRCASCGDRRKGGNLVVHHPIPPNGDRELLMDPNNLVVLCRSCHFQLHHHDRAEVAA